MLCVFKEIFVPLHPIRIRIAIFNTQITRCYSLRYLTELRLFEFRVLVFLYLVSCVRDEL